MSAHGFNRGHAMTYDEVNDIWRYDDTHQPVPDNPSRTCGHCLLPNRPDGHDACLGHVSGAMNACCGHGTEAEAYITCDDGKRFAGRRAIELLEMMPRLNEAMVAKVKANRRHD